MNIGPGAYAHFTYVPKWCGNRDLPEGEQVSCLIRRPTTAERFALENQRIHLKLQAWWDKKSASLNLNKLLSVAADAFDDQQLLMAYYFDHFTSEWTNVAYEDDQGARAMTDPVEIFLLTPISDEAPKDALCAEVFEVIRRAAGLSGEQLKNFVSQGDGTLLATGATTTATRSAEETATTATTPAAVTDLSS